MTKLPLWVLSLLLAVAIISVGLPALSAAAKDEASKPAKWKVSGAGFFQTRELKQQLNLIFGTDRQVFRATEIEDAALILISALTGEGYLEARAESLIVAPDGSVSEVEWTSDFDVSLSRDTEAKLVEFKLIEGPRFYYDELIIEGALVMEESEIEEFFYSKPLLTQGERSKVFTPSALTGGAANLEAELAARGYQAAVVTPETLSMDEESGAVEAKITVNEGKRYTIENLSVASPQDTGFEPTLDRDAYLGEPYSRSVSQDIARIIRNQYYGAGFPNVSVSATTNQNESANVVLVDLSFNVEPGPKLTVDSIEFEGLQRTKPGLVRSRLELENGEPLDPIKLDQSRLSLSRLGVFDEVSYQLVDAGPGEREILFNVEELSPWTIDALIGWGSYEQLRGGISAEKINLFGMGHRLRARSTLSFKSTLAEVRYLIPELFGTRTSFTSKLFGLQRQEVTFDRQEFGFDAGLSRKLHFLGVDLDTVYTFESLDRRYFDPVNDDGTGDKLSASLEVRLGRDRRDNPLNPREGYRYFTRFEYASKALGGEVDYQSLEWGLSYHGEISRGLLYHAGLTQGAIGSLTESQAQIPENKLFVVGGENSVRGYIHGEAAPIDAQGNFILPRAYTLLNLEIEQLLSESLSVVLFYDIVGTTGDIDEYPFEDTLSSIGLGARFRTFMGPVRIEYGYNLNQRVIDPSGSIHFSLGYPF